jgi:hypothetical protein
MAAVKHGLRYLAGTLQHGLLLGGHKYDIQSQLYAYADSDYANCVDTRRCVAGYITFFRSSPISWVSKKMPAVVLSTTEAEYMALCLLSQECLFLKDFLTEIHIPFPQPIRLYEDNQSTIKIVKNPELHGRSKHISIKVHFLKERVEDHTFVIIYVPTIDQIADILTKALVAKLFLSLRHKLRIRTLTKYRTGLHE